MALPVILGIATAAASAAQAVNQVRTARVNMENEKKLARIRAAERGEELRRTLAAQRVALISQNRNPDIGSSLVLRDEAIQNAGQAQGLDDFQTGITEQNYRAGQAGAVANAAGTALSVWNDYDKTKGAPKYKGMK